MDMTKGDTAFLIEQGERHGLLRNELAYVLATAYHETAHTMKPVRETLASTSNQAVSRLENAWQKGRLPWVKTPYWRVDSEGKSWHGRGYVQLTHKENYERLSNRLVLDLTTDPDVVMQPENAADVMIVGMIEGLFTGKKLSDYITLQRSDYVGARKIINGNDKAQLIAEYARKYDEQLLEMGYGVEDADVPGPTAPTPDPRIDRLEELLIEARQIVQELASG